MHRSIPCRSWAATRPLVGPPYRFEIPRYKIQKSSAGKRCWPHLWVHNLSRGGLGGHYQYPVDRVPPHTGSKSERRARCVLTRTHVSMTSGYVTRHGQLGCHHALRGTSSHLLTRGSSGAATCPMAPTPESQLGAARVLPCGPWRQLPPPDTWQLRSCHMSRDSGSCLLAQGSFRATTCPIELDELWAKQIPPCGIVIMISHRGVHISFKTPHDKADITCLRDM
jgi:hypothetical protein